MNRVRALATVFWALVASASLIFTPAKARADSADLPLHLEPVRLRPFYDYVDDAAVTAVDGGYYGLYGVYGIPLQSTGAAAYPNPLPLSSSWYYPGEIGAAQVSGDALVAWGDGSVYAALQAHADWTHASRPTVDLGPGCCPAVAGAGEAGLVVWKNGSLWAARLEAASWPSAGPTILVAEYPSDERAVSFSPEAQVYLVVWRYANVIHGRILTEQGLPLTGVQVIANVQANSLSVSWDGSNFVVVWSTANSVDAIRVSTAGVTVGQPIHVAGPDPLARFAKLASRSGESLVSWIEGGEYPEPTYRVRGARISPTGIVLDPGGFLIHDGARALYTYSPNRVGGVASDGDTYLVTWIENYASCGGIIVDKQDVLAAAVYPGYPPVAGPVQLVSGTAEQDGLGAAWVGDTIWTAWLGNPRIDDEMLAARRDAEGTLLDPAGIELGRVSSCVPWGHINNYSRPTVAGSPNVVLTTWHHFEWIENYGSFYYLIYLLHNEAGELVGGSDDRSNAMNSFGPQVAVSDGGQFLLAAIGPDPDDQPVLRWAGLSESGQFTTGGYFDLGAEEAPLDAASNGNGFLLAWSIAGDGRDAFVGRFNSDLIFLDPSGIPLATGPGDQALVRVASDGANYLAVWGDAGTLRAARIDAASGIVLDPGGFVVVKRAVAPFDLDWDGRHYVVAWAEQDATQDVVRIVRIAADGSSPDPAPVEVLRRSDDLITCSVASRGDGLSFITLTTRRPQPAGSTSGHGILYTNPATTAVAMPGAPAVAIGVRALPNPFGAEAVLLLGDRAGRPGSLRILDASGRAVRVFKAPDGLAPRVRWDGKDARGQRLSPGIYFYEVVAAGGAPATGKLIKLR